MAARPISSSWRGPAVAALVLVAACSGGSDRAATSSTTSTTAAATTTTTERPPLRPIPMVTAPLPKPGEALADGMHAVEITHVGDAELVVDVVQFLTGQEADDAYAEATGDRSGVPNDVYIRNTSKELRTLAVSGDVEVTLAWNATGPGQFSAHYDDLAAAVEKYRDPFWITVEGGAVTAIHEQYMP